MNTVYLSTVMQDPMDRVPLSYAILTLPSKRELRKKGYNVSDINSNQQRNHPLAKWVTHSLKRGATYRDALDAIEEANKKSWGLLKCRITFVNGGFDTFVRLDPNDPLTFKHTGTYDPNGVYKATTIEGSVASRVVMLPRLKPLVDERGHHLCSKPLPRSFAPQTMYKECPPPVISQAGYDFTPMSHNAFLLRPADPAKGVRDVKSDFMKNSSDYRPRSYLREETRGGVNSRHCHCAEVYQVGDYTADYARATDNINHRNRVVKKEFTKMGTLLANSAVVGRRYAKAPMFPCAHNVSCVKEDAVVNETEENNVAEAHDNSEASLERDETRQVNKVNRVHVSSATVR